MGSAEFRGVRESVLRSHAANAVAGRAVPGRRHVELEEHVRGLVPRATRDRASVGNCVPQPFAHVARHVVSAVRSDPGVSTDRRGAFAREVARADDRRSKRFEPLIQRHGGPVPVVRGWQLLAAISRVGDGLEPAHAGDRVVAGAVGVRACLPGRRSWASGRIDECRDCGHPVRSCLSERQIAPKFGPCVTAARR